jgi:anti-sigma factor (TIGR02949 family)
MDCDAAKTYVFAYVDGELEGPLLAALDAHLATCVGCRRLVALEREFRHACAPFLRREPAPPEVRARVQERLAALRRRAQGPRPWRARLRPVLLGGGLLAAGVALGLTGTSYLPWRDPLADLAEAAVEQHQRLARGLLPMDIHHVSPRGAEAWFRQRLTFNVSVPDLPAPNLTFRGGRISHLRDVEAAVLGYQVDGRDVSLFVIPAEAVQRLRLGETPRFRQFTRRGYDVIVWESREHGVGYALVSEIGGRACLVCHAPHELRDPSARPAHL